MKRERISVALCVLSMLGLSAASAAPSAKPAAKPAAKAQPVGPKLSPALNAAYSRYVHALQAKLDNKWYLADGRNHVVLSAKLDPNGAVTGLDISSTPKNVQAEQAATDAFNQCQPLAALPSGSPAVQLTITFASNADPHGENTRSISAQVTAQPPSPTQAAAGTTPPAAETNGSTESSTPAQQTTEGK